MLEKAILEDEVLSLTEAGTKETFELLTDENLSKTFSERLEAIIEKYNNRNDEADIFKVLEELVKFKHELLHAIDKGHEIGLSYEEKAFFDVLTADPEVINAMGDDILRKIARELTKTVRENMTHAWYEKAQAQSFQY